MDSLRKFKIAFFTSPENFHMSLREETVDVYGLFNFVVKAMTFSYNYFNVDANSTLLPNGTWTGLIGALNQSKVDFCPAPFIMTEERWDAVAYNFPYLCDDITFLTKKPSYNTDIMAIFQTLSAAIWFSLLISIVLMTVIFFIGLKYRYTLDDIILHILAIGLNQEGNIIPQITAETMLLFTWTVSMTLITFCFKSVLLSFLSFPPLTGVRNVPDLAAAIRAGKYSAMTIKSDYIGKFISGSPNEDIKLIGENTLISPNGSPEDLLGDEFSSTVASICKRIPSAYLQGKLFISRDSLGFYMQATAVREDFCCRDEIDMIIHRFLASGIDQKIRNIEDHQWAFYYLSDISDDDIARKITITNISGALILLVAGYCLSACSLIIELKIKCRKIRISSSI